MKYKIIFLRMSLSAEQIVTLNNLAAEIRANVRDLYGSDYLLERMVDIAKSTVGYTQLMAVDALQGIAYDLKHCIESLNRVKVIANSK